MQQELEELKQVQMEKQLQLKEAATRQKLIALKQKLKSDSKMPSTKSQIIENTRDTTANGTVNLPVTPKTAQSETIVHAKTNCSGV